VTINYIPKDQIPAALKGEWYDPYYHAVGPFMLSPNGGGQFMGMQLAWDGGCYVVFDGSHVKEFGDQYSAAVEGDTLVFRHRNIDEVMTLRPIVLSDARYINTQGHSYRTVEEMRRAILQSWNLEESIRTAETGDATLFPNGLKTPGPEATLAATIDDSDNVLELIYSEASGVYVRDNANWRLTDSDQDQPTIEDLIWEDVTPAFVPVYDNLTKNQNDITSGALADYLNP